jgi:rSAM/selenodomain-associated transferase 2
MNITVKEPVRFSVIIPVLNEGDKINDLMDHLQTDIGFGGYPLEIIVVDGSPVGDTIKLINTGTTVKTLMSPKGRARQMNAGARVAGGDILIFLHADTVLPKDALAGISEVMEKKSPVGGAFDLSYRSHKRSVRLIASLASIRSRLTRIPYGDQAIFIRKNYFDEIGGYSEIPFLEDVELMRRIKKRGDRIHILRQSVLASPRRLENEGLIRCTLRNRIVTALYFMGMAPEKLAAFYRYR